MLTIEELIARAGGLVYEKTQRGPAGLELTLKAVHRLGTGGALDFGGSEYREAEWSQVPSRKSSEEDKYGWWHLSAGLYRIEFNETLALREGERALLSPHPRLLAAGATHASAVFGPDEVLFANLAVSEAGLALKENCRTSRLNVLLA